MKITVLLATSALLALAGCSGSGDAGNTTSEAAAIAAPEGGDWTSVASKTPQEGMLIGNPAAPVKLLEFGALSCSHCAEFDKVGHEPLMSLVKKGTVSYEYRTFLLNAFDIPTSLLARCNGAAPFFPIARQLFAAQHDWIGKAQGLPKDAQQKLQSMTPNQSAAYLAENLGLIDFVGQFGVGADQAKACLADPAGIAALEKIVKDGNEEFQITGTPTFVINGKKVEGGTWEAIEPLLKQAGA